MSRQFYIHVGTGTYMPMDDDDSYIVTVDDDEVEKFIDDIEFGDTEWAIQGGYEDGWLEVNKGPKDWKERMEG